MNRAYEITHLQVIYTIFKGQSKRIQRKLRKMIIRKTKKISVSKYRLHCCLSMAGPTYQEKTGIEKIVCYTHSSQEGACHSTEGAPGEALGL